jgi:hypothetical protein
VNSSVRFGKRFGDYTNVRKNGHEVRIAVPPRDDMDVKMLFESGSGHLSKIDSDVESLGIHGLLQGGNAAPDVHMDVEDLFGRKPREIGRVSVRRDHEVTGIIWECVADDEAVFSACDDLMFLVAIFLRVVAKKTPVVVPVRHPDICHAPRREDVFHIITSSSVFVL